MDVNAIQEKLETFANERNWEQFHSPKNLSMALVGEAAELLEIFQWLTEDESREIVKSYKKMSAIKEEIADIFIYLARLSDKLGVNIEQAVLDKIEANSQKYPVELAKDNAVKYNDRDK